MDSLFKAIEKKGYLKEFGSNKYYRRWCFLVEPKLNFKDWVYKTIKEEYEKIRGRKIQGSRTDISQDD